MEAFCWVQCLRGTHVQSHASVPLYMCPGCLSGLTLVPAQISDSQMQKWSSGSEVTYWTSPNTGHAEPGFPICLSHFILSFNHITLHEKQWANELVTSEFWLVSWARKPNQIRWGRCPEKTAYSIGPREQRTAPKPREASSGSPSKPNLGVKQCKTAYPWKVAGVMRTHLTGQREKKEIHDSLAKPSLSALLGEGKKQGK